MEKIWLKHYPPGVTEHVDLEAYDSVVDLFSEACTKFADRPALSNFGVTLSYRQIDQMSQHFAAYLQQALGLKKGDRIAIMLPNILQYHVAMFGALRAGLVIINVNPLYTADELSQQLADAGAIAIVVLANFAKTVQKALPETILKHVIVTEIGDLFGFLKKTVMNFAVRYIKKMVPEYQLPHEIPFAHALKIGSEKTLSPVTLTRNDIACLQYTGGTTGVPKAAILSNGNLVANTIQAYSWIAACGLNEGKEVAIMPLPLYHIFSMTVCGLCFLKMGALGVLVTNPKDIPSFIKLLKKTPFSVLVGINTLYNALLHHPDVNQVNFTHLKLAVAGGMALHKTVAESWYEKTGVKILEGYGLTETSPIVTINSPNAAVFTGSIGLPVPSTDIAFRNEEGEVPLGAEGELCVKGPQVMQAYWQNDAETKNVFTEDGYFKTGDIARMDEKGLIYLVDRKKDMVVVSGFNVYPTQIETVLTAHPKISEAGVIGVPCEQTGEMVKAFIVREDNTLTAEAVTDYCHEHLTNYKVPKSIVFVDELPKSNVGKVLRRELHNLEKVVF